MTPDLIHSFPAKDIGFLRIVAGLWGIALASTSPAEAASELAEGLCDAALVEEVTGTLPDEGRTALQALAGQEGRIPWAAFVRRYGEVREMGPGRRDRETPHLHPASAAEMLWYRALLARAFFDGPNGPQEYAYIPDEMLQALELIEFGQDQELNHEVHEERKGKHEGNARDPGVSASPPGRAAVPGERAHTIPASDRVLDDACTLLAALRMGMTPPGLHVPVPVLGALLTDARLLVDGVPQADAVKEFLAMPRAEALDSLRNAWRASDAFDELRHVPNLVFEGERQTHPVKTREFVLGLLASLPGDRWWSLPAFVQDVKQRHPDYQRPAGDYDSWFIRRESDGTYLRGFESWDEVDGALVHFFIAGPLYWLGLVALAAPDAESAPSAFRLAHAVHPPELGKCHVSSQDRITVQRWTPRPARYQIARFSEWDEERDDEYRYRVTPLSLGRAREQGLKADALLKLLHKHAAAPIPPAFQRALQRWEMNGTEARIAPLAVLRVSRPEVLAELRKSRAARFLGDPLGPTAVIIKPGAQARVLAALAELGLLTDLKADSETDSWIEADQGNGR